MPERRLSAVVLAAGEGTRMRSERPKPLHLLCGRPMILHVLDAMAEVDVRRVVVVVGHRGEWVTKTLVQLAPPAMRIEFVEQPIAAGLMDAVRLGRDFAGHAPLAVALPDNLFVGDAPGLAQVIESYYRTGLNVVAVVELFLADASRRGATGAVTVRQRPLGAS